MTHSISQLHKAAVHALNKGDYRSLHQCSLQLLSIDNQHADAWFFLSIVAAAQRQIKKAIELIDRALLYLNADEHIKADTNSKKERSVRAEYLAQKAKYHSLIKQDRDALQAANNAKQLKPTDALTLDTLGVVYTNLAKYRDARELLSQAVDLQPGNPQFQFNLATTEQFLGNSHAAKQHYEAAIAIHPTFARAYWSLSELEKNRLDGSRTKALETLQQKHNLRPDDQLYIAHALSREYEQAGDYNKALEVLHQAKKRKADQIQYSIEQDQHLFNTMQTAFASIQPSDQLSRLGEGVIFIVGMPRSGTTLIERVLSSHSEVESLGELQNFSLSVRKCVNSKSIKTLDQDIIEKAMAVEPEKIGQDYLASIAERRPSTQFFIDKMPLNFLYVGFIRRCLPAAKIICLQRNPMDTCLSNYRQLFAIDFSYYNYHYRLDDTARYYAAFYKLMQFWKDTYPDSLYELNYDRFTHTPEPIARELLDFIGLEWQPQCLEFHKNTSAVSTPSASQVREKLYTSAVGRWQKYESHLQSVKEYFDSLGIPYR